VDYVQDQGQIADSLFIVKGSRVDNMLRIAIHDNLTLENEGERWLNDRCSHTMDRVSPARRWMVTTPAGKPLSDSYA